MKSSKTLILAASALAIALVFFGLGISRRNRTHKTPRQLLTEVRASNPNFINCGIGKEDDPTGSKWFAAQACGVKNYEKGQSFTMYVETYDDQNLINIFLPTLVRCRIVVFDKRSRFNLIEWSRKIPESDDISVAYSQRQVPSADIVFWDGVSHPMLKFPS